MRCPNLGLSPTVEDRLNTAAQKIHEEWVAQNRHLEQVSALASGDGDQACGSETTDDVGRQQISEVEPNPN